MRSADFSGRKNRIRFWSGVSSFILFSLCVPLQAQAANSTVIHAPCSDSSQPTTLSLRSCSAYIPQLLKQVSNPGAPYPIPIPAPSSSAIPLGGMMQMYASAYYQGIDLDPSPGAPTLPGNMYPGNTFGVGCELVPSTLNHNQSETTTQSPQNNPSSPSCGTPMQLSAQIATCAAPTAAETALLASLGYTQSQLDGLSSAQINALISQASVPSTQGSPNPQASALALANQSVINAAPSGRAVCVTLNSSGQNGSLERAYLKGTFVQALSYYTDQVLNQLSCAHTISLAGSGNVSMTDAGLVAGTACQNFANKLVSLQGSTQQSMNALQGMLGSQVNLKDINACNTQTFSSLIPATGTTYDPGALRQSAQHLCSAQTAMEAAFSQLVICDIFSQAQMSYVTNTGSPAAQLNLINAMNNPSSGGTSNLPNLDTICRNGTGFTGTKYNCGGSKDVPSLNTCLAGCYKTEMPSYMKAKFQSLWPQPTPPYTGACVGANSNGP